MNEQQDILPSLVKAVAAGEMLLHDDRQNLMSKEDLIVAVSSNRLFTGVGVSDLNKLPTTLRSGN